MQTLGLIAWYFAELKMQNFKDRHRFTVKGEKNGENKVIDANQIEGPLNKEESRVIARNSVGSMIEHGT